MLTVSSIYHKSTKPLCLCVSTSSGAEGRAGGPHQAQGQAQEEFHPHHWGDWSGGAAGQAGWGGEDEEGYWRSAGSHRSSPVGTSGPHHGWLDNRDPQSHSWCWGCFSRAATSNAIRASDSQLNKTADIMLWNSRRLVPTGKQKHLVPQDHWKNLWY